MATSAVQRPLTSKQVAFVTALLDGLNGVDAAIRAGYAGGPNTLAVMASQLIRKPHVVAALETGRRHRAERAEIEHTRSAADISRVAWSIAEDIEAPVSARVAALSLEARRYREYSDKQEHSGPDGGPIPHEVAAVFAQMTPPELRKLLQGGDTG